MGIFVIFRVSNPELMRASLVRTYPNDHLEVHAGEWILSASGTAKEVSDKLGVTTGTPAATPVGTAMIFSMSSYFGRATTEIWDWIKVKAEAPGG